MYLYYSHLKQCSAMKLHFRPTTKPYFRTRVHCTHTAYYVYLLVDYIVCLHVFFTGGIVIEFESEWLHGLGQLFQCQIGDDTHDIEPRKSSLIYQTKNILCDFRNVDCNTKMRFVEAHSTIPLCHRILRIYPVAILFCIAKATGIRQEWRLSNTILLSLYCMGVYFIWAYFSVNRCYLQTNVEVRVSMFKQSIVHWEFHSTPSAAYCIIHLYFTVKR